jgi:hypothetical protein
MADDRVAHTFLVLEAGAQRLGVLGAQLEDVTHLDGLADGQRGVAERAGLALLHLAQVEPLVHGDVAGQVHVAQVEAVLVGAGGHRGSAAQVLVGVDLEPGHAHRAQASRAGAQHRTDLLVAGGA